MNIMVTVKWVGPAEQAQVAADGTVSFAGAKAHISEYDAVALQAARELAAATGSPLVGVAVGPASIDTPASRKAMLARGLDRLVMVVDDTLAHADSLTTARVLAAVARTEEAALVVCGDSSADLGNHQVGPLLGALLGAVTLTGVSQLQPAGSGLSAQVTRGAEVLTLTIDACAVISIAPGAVTVPVPGMKDLVAAARKPVTVLTLADLGVEPSVPAQLLAATPVAGPIRIPHVIAGTDPQAAARELVTALRERDLV